VVMRWDLSGAAVLELDDMHRVRRVDDRRWWVVDRRVVTPRPRVMVEDEIQVMVGLSVCSAFEWYQSEVDG
jgi:hypothetical protein